MSLLAWVGFTHSPRQRPAVGSSLQPWAVVAFIHHSFIIHSFIHSFIRAVVHSRAAAPCTTRATPHGTAPTHPHTHTHVHTTQDKESLSLLNHQSSITNHQSSPQKNEDITRVLLEVGGWREEGREKEGRATTATATNNERRTTTATTNDSAERCVAVMPSTRTSQHNMPTLRLYHNLPTLSATMIDCSILFYISQYCEYYVLYF